MTFKLNATLTRVAGGEGNRLVEGQESREEGHQACPEIQVVGSQEEGRLAFQEGVRACQACQAEEAWRMALVEPS